MLLTLAIALGLALVLGMLAQHLKCSPLVGYIAAGIISGHLFGEQVDAEMVAEFSHIGIILLLFGVGLQFHFKDLALVRRIVVPGAVSSILLITALGAFAYSLFGASDAHPINNIMYGLCICISSTVVLTRILSDNHILHTRTGHTALGWLVVEDIFTIVLLVLLPSLVGMNSGSVSTQELIVELLWLILKIGILLLLLIFGAGKLIPKMLGYVSRSNSSDLFTLAVLVTALGIAVLSSYVFNASMEFGAFISGMLVGQSRFSARAASEALPMRDAFAVLFFVSVGMGFRMEGIAEYWQLTLATAFICIIAKPIIAFILMRMNNCTSRLSVGVAGSLSQIGEFSFILAALAAHQYELLPASAANVILGVAILSISLNSFIYKFVPRIIDKLEARGIGLLHEKNPKNIPAPRASYRHRAIIVGYGPCGKLVTNILLENKVDVVVLEMNIDTIKQLESEGIPAILGDARLERTLIMAGAEESHAIIVTAAAAPAKVIAQAARNVNPKMRFIAHTSYMSDAQQLRKEGAESIFSGEEEVIVSMGSFILSCFSASDEQIRSSRRKMRESLRKNEEDLV